MKNKKYSIILFVAFLFTMLLNINASAINTGFSSEELQVDEKQIFESNFEISLIHNSIKKRGIQCFDVSETGKIAIGQTGSNEKEICVYSSDGNFLYGYSFDSNGSFVIEWDSEFINIYLDRSGIIVSVDSQANIQDIKKVQNTVENNIYRNYLGGAIKKTDDGTKYTTKKDMGILNLFSSSYSMLVIVNSLGEENTVYDVKSNLMLVASLKALLFVGVFCFAIYQLIIKTFILKKTSIFNSSNSINKKN